jgi:4-hydroxy-3-polyprenylbenzoate decarboxylase
MAFKSLRHFISDLEKAGELVRVDEFVSPKLEIPEIVDRLSKNNGPAVLFTNNGTPFPLLINSMGSEKRICMALGLASLDQVRHEIGAMVREFLGPKRNFFDKLRLLPALKDVASWMPATVGGRGSCQEVVMDPPDLGRLPVLTCWPADGGPFITLPGVHTKDPETGQRNLGMYRMQVFGPDLTGMHWHLHKGSAHHYMKYQRSGMKMPVTVTLGGDPAYTYAATAPLPENLDEYLLAGFLRKKRVELVKCLTNDLEVPSDVDFVIEGYVDPAEELILEGPFGDHTGFYSLAGMFPRFHVTCITHRKDAVYPATIVGTPPQEDAWIGKATEKIFLEPIRLSVAPELEDMHMPPEGVFHNIVLASIRSQYPGNAPKVMNALWGAGQMMFNKVMVVTDEDVRPDDYAGVLQAIALNADPVDDIHFMNGPVDILDHSSRKYALGSKMGIDATRKAGMPPNKIQPSLTIETRDALMHRFGEITAVNDTLLHEGIPLLILGFRKSQEGHARLLACEIAVSGLAAGMRYILFTDPEAAELDLSLIAWLAANNIDPVRDCFHYVDKESGRPALYMDATKKTSENDHFSREWPNVIVMDEETIREVDRKWPSYGLGPLLPSPSVKFKSLVFKTGAVS